MIEACHPVDQGEPMERLDQARKRLDDEFGQVRHSIDKIHDALDEDG